MGNRWRLSHRVSACLSLVSFRLLKLGLGSAQNCRIDMRFRSRQGLSEQATCTGDPLHASDKNREESSAVSSLVEGTFWIRKKA